MRTYHKGDPIVHPTYGAGVIEDTRDFIMDGDTQQYAVVHLTGGNHLLLPMNRLEEIGVRPAGSSFEEVDQIFAKDPRELSTNPKIRQARIRKRVLGGNPLRLAEVLRDLAWYEQDQRLLTKDTIYQDRARHLLASELALRHDIEIDEAAQQLEAMLSRTMSERRDALAQEEALQAEALHPEAE